MEASLTKTNFIAGLLFIATAWTGGAVAGDTSNYFKAKMSGADNIPTIYTPAYGTLKTEVDPYGEYIYFKLYYENFTTKVRQANIHFSQKFANGGANLFLCGGPKPACPEYSGYVEGKLYAEDIIGPAAQGIEPGDIKSVIKAMKKGLTYGNVHTEQYKAGEIRGQIIPVGKKSRGM
ncbi:hypothetical protein MNBD_GAMMA13-1554 [hydrothermal vent metagenome]|uniref:CHRD domain-containing protein n=1 Tax=hydrothermal vent metagenome TaxID=652676 RepID=A0A3B0YJL8_9ZZZZ